MHVLIDGEMRKLKTNEVVVLFDDGSQGVVASGIAFAVQIWCIDRGGPVFVAVYQPVQTFVVAIMASIALGEEFYLGGLVPSLLIILLHLYFHLQN